MTYHLKDELARLRHERADLSKRAAKRREDAIDLRRRGDPVGALKADSRAGEYRLARNRIDARDAYLKARGSNALGQASLTRHEEL